ncbi:MAG: PAS domain-containing sensor histidine kinase, partial [Chloroflexi bacterium]|nr:PAS domain-containing sensor histidine kinase [Chloroflexota bacterium]
LAERDEERRTLRDLADLSRDGLIACDRRLGLTFCNRAATTLLGVAAPADDGTGRWPNGLGPVRAALGRALLGRESTLRVPRFLEGRRICLDAVARPVFAEDGELIGAALRIADPARDQPGAVAVLEEVQTLARRLQAPLGSIGGFAAMLREEAAGTLNPLQRELADSLSVEARSAIGTIQRFLESSSARTTEVFTVAPCDVGRLVVEAAERITPAAEQRGVQVRLRLVNPLPIVHGCSERLARLLHGLLDNAVSFSPAGAHVEVFAGELEGRLRITVSDQGPGVPVADRERIFDRFYRAENQPRTGRHGMGLGLTICRYIAEEHGGQVWAHDSVLGGAGFTVSLPRRSRAGRLAALSVAS